MKKKYLIIGSLACMQFVAKAQMPKDSIKEKINKTEIEVVYNHYLQDGNNSAVTGGKGTEKLTVYGPMLNFKKTWSKNSLALNCGTDIISSASTDNIDFVMSSASLIDTRTYANTTYEQKIEKTNLSIYGGLGFSIESDYFSVGSKIGMLKEDRKNLTNYTVQFQMFNDDLLWGRINPDYYKPVKLIYPVELRYKEWYDVHNRNSYNLILGFSKAIEKKTIVGIYPEIIYQNGLLSTPFHRVYFSDGSLGVEQLPNERWKGALALKLNKFIGGNVILKNTVNGYFDDFGIIGFCIENEVAVKIKPDLIILPNIRAYLQTDSKYFDKYMKHNSNDIYYTSDFDLSNFQSYNAGIGLKYNPYKYLSRQMIFNSFLIRYNFMYRTNGLSAHIFSISFRTEWNKK